MMYSEPCIFPQDPLHQLLEQLPTYLAKCKIRNHIAWNYSASAASQLYPASCFPLFCSPSRNEAPLVLFLEEKKEDASWVKSSTRSDQKTFFLAFCFCFVWPFPLLKRSRVYLKNSSSFRGFADDRWDVWIRCKTLFLKTLPSAGVQDTSLYCIRC